MKTIFDILDGRVIVHSDKEEGYLYTWNGELTALRWHWYCGGWEECGIMTFMSPPKSLTHATNRIIAWANSRGRQS